jgi:hypothetical protein
MTLVNEIFRLLAKHGHKELNVRQMDAVIAGVNTILKDLKTLYTPASPDIGLKKWLESDDAGLSSKFMACILAGGPPAENNHPHDPDDFVRCLKFLRAVPDCLPLITMAMCGPVWAGLVEKWNVIASLLQEEVPGALRGKPGKAPRTYALMQTIIAEGQEKEGQKK